MCPPLRLEASSQTRPRLTRLHSLRDLTPRTRPRVLVVEKQRLVTLQRHRTVSEAPQIFTTSSISLFSPAGILNVAKLLTRFKIWDSTAARVSHGADRNAPPFRPPR